MALYRSPWSSLVHFTQDLGYGSLNLENLSYTDFTLKIKRAGEPFIEVPMTPERITEQDAGWYEVHWTEEDMGVIGEFYFLLTPNVSGSMPVEKIFEVVPPPLYFPSMHPYCIVTGNIVDISGASLQDAHIVFRPRSVPVLAGPALVGASILRATPDAFGNFSIKLLRNIQVLVEIEGAGIRHLITVPDVDTASIIDLLPPVPPPL